jgi:glycolate oxidase iron-sulfur subunit
MAEQVMEAIPGDAVILADSAGCGAALKDYGRLFGSAEAQAFSARVEDLAEWLAPRVGSLPAGQVLELRVAIQDPCHLRHVQRVHLAVRELLAPFVAELVELDDEGLCCGAGGTYSAFEPELAGAIRERKLASISRAACDVVASANPGCSMHLSAGGAATVHPISLVARSLGLGGAMSLGLGGAMS